MSKGHVPELDGIRGIAILLVLLFHFSLGATTSKLTRPLEFGWCGVDLFFVLSGCLITGILLESKGAVNYFRVFYARRVLRIFPLYFGAIAVIFWLILPVLRNVGKPASWAAIPASEQLWYWMHVSNWRTAFGHFDGEPIGHFWSLAIEEQFYLLWPVIVFLCPPKRLMWIVGILLLACLGFRNLPALQPIQMEHPQFLYRLTPARIDALAAGAAIPLVLQHKRLSKIAAVSAGPCALLSLSGIALYLASGQPVSLASTAMAHFGYTLLALAFGSLVLYTQVRAGTAAIPARVLRSPFLGRFGAYSYGMYVIHPMFAMFLRKGAETYLPPRLVPAVPIAIGIPVTYALAWCSWHLFEKRFWSMKGRFSYRFAAFAESDSLLDFGIRTDRYPQAYHW